MHACKTRRRQALLPRARESARGPRRKNRPTFILIALRLSLSDHALQIGSAIVRSQANSHRARVSAAKKRARFRRCHFSPLRNDFIRGPKDSGRRRKQKPGSNRGEECVVRSK